MNNIRNNNEKVSYNYNNLDLKHLKIFVQKPENNKLETKNIINNSDIKIIKNYIKKFPKEIYKEKDNFKNLNFKNYKQLTQDISNIEDNSFDTNHSNRDTLDINKENFDKNIKKSYLDTKLYRNTLNILDNSIDSIKNKKDKFSIKYNKLEISNKTTLMIKNIPNKITKQFLIKLIDKNHKGKYNILHLPFDLNNNCNMGYAFINFTRTSNIKDFYLEFNNKKWNLYNSGKICEIKYAKNQGYSYYKNLKIN